MFPPIPPVSGLHVLVVHFPIALLLVAPLFVLIGIAAWKHRMTWSTAALTLMAAGTLAACVATATGEEAEEGAEFSDDAAVVLNQHEHLAERARNLFLGLTAVYGGFVLFNRYRKPLPFVPFVAATGVFLVAYAGAALVLANAAHAGGRLVHEFGVRSPTAESATTQKAGD